ncbi:MAG: 50S ribosomal protein L21 [Nitrospirae bacterium]|nr:MAG: 50S ribosomal protein L21 [Nitrospirota bacterium]
MYAIITTGGKQYRAEPGAILQIESIPGAVGERIEFANVGLIAGDGEPLIGHPIIPDAAVKAEIIRHGRTRSIRIFKKKRRKNYRRTKGHRQAFTQIRITDIITPSS